MVYLPAEQVGWVHGVDSVPRVVVEDVVSLVVLSFDNRGFGLKR